VGGDLSAAPELVDFAPEVVVASPASRRTTVIAWVREQGIALWGDIELAWRVRDKVLRPDGTPAEWVLITGTNGKTTTTQLTARCSSRAACAPRRRQHRRAGARRRARSGGFDVLVVELSSHQLWYLSSPRARALSPLRACASTSPTTTSNGTAPSRLPRREGRRVPQHARRLRLQQVRRRDSQMVEEAEVVEGCRAIGFDLGVPGPSDLGVVDGILVDRAFLEDRRTSALELTTVATSPRGPRCAASWRTSSPPLPSRARWMSRPRRSRGLGEFRLDPHRIEVVAVAAASPGSTTRRRPTRAAASSLAAFPVRSGSSAVS
jgi:UDP-N-acetylmuramoylalanine--D-glutamate ligase